MHGKAQPFFNGGHGRKIIFGHGAVMDTGIGQGGVEMPVTEQGLNGGNFAASVEQLGGVGVAQLVRRHLDPGTFPGRFDTAADEILAHRPVAVEEDVVGCATAAPRQVCL